MRGKTFRNQGKIVDESKSKSDYWKRRPSEIRGYQKAYYINDSDGSYIRIDYNLKDKKVRLYMEDSGEGGIAYYSVISNGNIVSEKNLATGRTTSLNHKFSPLAQLVASVPHKDVVSLFGSCYGISESFKELKDAVKRKKLERTREKYFVEEKKAPLFGSFSTTKKFSWIDLIDMIVSVGAFAVIFNVVDGRYWEASGAFLALCGVVAGVLDIVVRKREPIFSKILLLLLAGVCSYFYGRFFF